MSGGHCFRWMGPFISRMEGLEMNDQKFRSMEHRPPEGYVLHTRGDELSVGYKPDLSYSRISSHSSRWIIMEYERKTDRKAYLGDLVKAEKFATECCVFVDLVIVMAERKNTTVDQISNHLAPYLTWLHGYRGVFGFGVDRLFVCSDKEYIRHIRIFPQEVMMSDGFLGRGRLLSC